MKKLKSHPCFNGATEFYEHDSDCTQTKMKFSIYRPLGEIKGGLIWLSGLTCTDENFMAKAGAQRLLNELGMAIICPDTSPRGLDLPGEHLSYDFGSGAGFYVDATTAGYKEHYQMYSYINEEIYSLFGSEFDLKGRVGIMGHSMGGHGALTIGLKNPDQYKSISAFSPITNPVNCEWGKKALKGYLGDDQVKWQEHDACAVLARGGSHPQEILIDQGLADDFYPDELLTKNFEESCAATSQPVKVNYHESYDHSYYFISTFMESHIRHHYSILEG